MNQSTKKVIIFFAVICAILFSGVFLFSSQKERFEYFLNWFFVSEQNPVKNPNEFSSYSESEIGYLKYDPFSFQKNSNDVIKLVSIDEDEYYKSIDVFADGVSWSQEDFFSTINQISISIWNEPLDLKVWKIYSILFEGVCKDNINGFQSMSITLYKINKKGFTYEYIARKIDIEPISGVAQWAGDKAFSRSYFFRWDGFDISKINISADQALLIAEQNGGQKARIHAENKCEIYVDMPRDNNNLFWLVEYDFGLFLTKINAYSGKVFGASSLQ